MYKVTKQLLSAKKISEQKQVSYENYVAGNWTSPEGKEYYPATYCVTACEYEQKLPRSTSIDINTALTGAKEAVFNWSRLSPAIRCQMIRKIAQELLIEKEALICDELLEEGENLSESKKALEQTLSFYSRQRIIIPTLMVQSKEGSQELLKSGSVVKQVSPINANINEYLDRVFTVLAGGHCLVNCVLLESDYRMPLALLRFVEVAGRVLPNGVINVVFGFASEAGSTLVYSNKAITAIYVRNQSSIMNRKNSQFIH